MATAELAPRAYAARVGSGERRRWVKVNVAHAARPLRGGNRE
jgi:hypothetical protein